MKRSDTLGGCAVREAPVAAGSRWMTPSSCDPQSEQAPPHVQGSVDDRITWSATWSASASRGSPVGPTVSLAWIEPTWRRRWSARSPPGA